MVGRLSLLGAAVAGALFCSLALPATASPGIAFLPPAPGQRLHYHIVHTVQTADGTQTTTTDVTIVRRTGTTLVAERTVAGGTPNLSILKAGTDGALVPSDDAPSGAADAGLNDALAAVNLAIAATREGDPSASLSWNANVPLTAAPRAAVLPALVMPGRLAGTDFDFEGLGQSALTGGVTATVHITGHASGGRAQRITIVLTRAVTIAGLPYVNAGSWSIVTGETPGR